MGFSLDSQMDDQSRSQLTTIASKVGLQRGQAFNRMWGLLATDLTAARTTISVTRMHGRSARDKPLDNADNITNVLLLIKPCK